MPTLQAELVGGCSADKDTWLTDWRRTLSQHIDAVKSTKHVYLAQVGTSVLYVCVTEALLSVSDSPEAVK